MNTTILRSNSRRHPCACFGVMLLLVVLAGSGCITQKPLPFAHSPPAVAPANAPALSVLPTKHERPEKDNMDKVLALPACMDPVLVTELERSGLFSCVRLETNGTPAAGYVVQGRLRDLRWEVPDYDAMLGTVFVVSFLTGGIGGVIYGSTSTDVFGHATVHFVVSDAQGTRVFLDRDYVATAKEKKSKFKCDTPGTYRLVAAKAYKEVLDRFKDDVRQLDLK